MTATLADVAEVTGRYTNVSGPAGIPWTRDTVTNLENGRRTRLAVHELLALAYVLGLATPADLLMPKTAPRIPVTPVTEAATLDARAWCWGQIGPLRDWLAAEPSEREASAALVQDGRGRGPGGSEQAGGGAGRQRWPQLRTLGRTDGKSFVAAKTAELAPTTVETAYAVLRALGSAAVEDGVIPANPFARVRLPTVPERSPSVPRAFPERSPSVPRASWCRWSPPRCWRSPTRSGRGCGWPSRSVPGRGCASARAAGLTVERVDFLRRRVHVLEQAQRGALAPLKTKASRRVVPAGEWLLAEVSADLQRYGPGALAGSSCRTRSGGSSPVTRSATRGGPR